MKKFITLAALGASLAAQAADSPLWLRHPAISPDGTQVAFTYKGDIFTVPVEGGRARQLTTHAAYDTAPVWSPDGESIAFASTRQGSSDIYVMPAGGGTARRLTTHSGNETPLAFLNDTTVLFSARRMPGFSSMLHPNVPQVYAVSTTGGRDRLWQPMAMNAISVSADGRVAYQDRKGVEDVMRKHERSSGTADIWIMDGDRHTRVTTFNGQDQSPVWAGADRVAYISEQDGTLNVWVSALDGSQAKALTHFTKHPVRSLSRSAATGTMAFTWNGELYTLREGQEPVKIPVEIVADDYTADLQRSVKTNGATCMAPSPDGSEVAFVLRGDVYVTSTKYNTTRRITNTPEQERVVAFAPDGRTLVYDSERDGRWQLFTATIKDKDEKSFAYATEVVESPLYSSPEGLAAQQPAYSPDGKKVAFLEDRTTLRVIDLDSHKVTTALPGKYNYSYTDGDVDFTWSPDSRWFLTSYIGTGGWNNTDIALVKADGTEVVDLTESGYSDRSPRWAMDGRAVTYVSSRYGMRNHGSWGEQGDVMLMVLDGDAWDEFNRTEEEAALAKDKDKKKDGDADDKDEDKPSKKDKKKADKKDAKADKKADKKVKPLVFDLDNRHYRTVRLTGLSSSMGDYWLDKDGATLYYIAGATEGGRNLLARDIKDGSTKVHVKGVSGGIEPDKKGENLYVLGSNMYKIPVKNPKLETIKFEADYDRHPSLERQYIYDHMHRQVRDKFYDKNLHGVDWEGYGKDYARFLPHIDNGYDFAELLSEILGELNASHTGGSYRGPGADMSTASLGAFFDDSYYGAGLKVTSVLPRGPLADKKASVKPGDIITAIDGVEIAPGADYFPLLDGKSGKRVRLTVKRGDGKTENVTVRPVSAGALSDLLYQRWVERNAHVVDSLSGGRIGYVHVREMNSSSFRDVYSRLLGKYRNCDAVVVDTRWNGGGWLHNDIALLLGGKEYVRYTPRGQYIGSDPFSQWTKPSAMLVNEANYSDAHGTPYTYQTLGIGPVVGAPVPGTMTAVWWENQIDPNIVFGIPQVTSLDRNGKPLENQQLNPDILIYNDPADVKRGRDAQLEGAVRHLLEKIGK